MDVESGLIGAIISAICIFPFVVMYYNRVKREKKIIQALQKSAQLNNCTISQHEFCGDFLIAMDESKGFVFFYKERKEASAIQSVDLAEVQSCKVVKQSRGANNSAANPAVVERLSLDFVSGAKGNVETRFELYNEEDYLQLRGELQLAEKWAAKITGRLKRKK